MDLREIGLGGGGDGLDSTGSGQGPVVGCCECGDEPSGSCATELVSYVTFINYPQSCSLIVLIMQRSNHDMTTGLG
jgi:hypothetical protein